MKNFTAIINIVLLINDAYVHYFLFKLLGKKIYLLTLAIIIGYIAMILTAYVRSSIPDYGVITACITVGTLANYISAAFNLIGRKQQ